MPAAKKSSSIYAVIGTDEGRVSEVALALARKFAPPDDEFGLEIINGQSDNSDHVNLIVRDTIEAIQTLPFFGGDKVVWLQGVNFLGDTVTGRSETTLGAVSVLQDQLEAGLPPGVTLILSVSEIDKRRTFYKKLSSVAKVEVFDKVDINKDSWQRDLGAIVSQWAREIGFAFDGEALDEFVLRVGVDTRQLRNELEKVSLYLGDRRRATVSDVEAIVAATHTGVIFEIGRALTERDLPRTIRLIEQQIAKGESAVALLLAAIVPQVRNLLQARDLRERFNISANQSYQSFGTAIGRLPERETAHLPRKKDGGLNVWGLYQASQLCGKFSAAELRDALAACLEANLRLVTTGLEPRLVLSQLVTKILARRPGTGKSRAA